MVLADAAVSSRPPAYDLQGFQLKDLIDFTPALRAEAEKVASLYKLGPVFTPPVVSKTDGPLATLAMATAEAAPTGQAALTILKPT